MKNRFVLLVAVLAMVLAITGCSTSATEVKVVEQELPTETPTSEEVEKIEEVDTTKSEEVAVIKTEENEDNNVDESTVQVDSDIADTDEVSEEATMEKTEQTSQPEKTEVHEATVDEIEPVETKTVTKEEPTGEVMRGGRRGDARLNTCINRKWRKGGTMRRGKRRIREGEGKGE